MKYNFRFFIKEGAGNMFSHGFMSFAAIGISVACLLIMGTFTLVAYNANENLSDLQQENAVVAFVDDSLTETQARDLQAQLEKVDNVADCTFMSRDEAKENYIEKYDGDELYGDLPADVFRHRYVIHVTDPDRIMETKTAVEQVKQGSRRYAKRQLTWFRRNPRRSGGGRGLHHGPQRGEHHQHRPHRHSAAGVGVHHLQHH